MSHAFGDFALSRLPEAARVRAGERQARQRAFRLRRSTSNI
jgi:hypothetical protein